MKRCPQCRRDYTDETLNFCLDDGSALLDGPASFEDSPTAVLPSAAPESEASTRSQVSLTDPTSAFQVSKSSRSVGKRRYIFTVAIAVLLIGAGVFAYYKLAGSTVIRVSFESAKFTRVTSAGRVLTSAISPDGKWLAYLVADGRRQSVWMQQVDVPGSSREIIPASENNHRGLAFSPDSNYLYYSSDPPGARIGSLFQMPVNGGSSRKILDGIAGAISFSPDGKRIAYFNYQGDEDQLMVSNADGSGQRMLAGRRGREFFYEGYSTPAWSPDGKVIATSIGWNDPARRMGIAIVDPETGSVNPLELRNFNWVDQANWLADGSSLLVLANETLGEIPKIWQIEYPSGNAQRIAQDLNIFDAISLTKDSNTLAVVRGDGTSNIWVAPLSDISRGSQITQGSDQSFRPRFTPDGKIVYTKRSGEVQDLFIIDQAGGVPKQLTVTANAGVNGGHEVSPDGKTIVFVSDRGENGTGTLWRMNIDGTEPKQLTTDSISRPVFSPDGKDVYYVSTSENERTTWKIPFDGGSPVRLSECRSSSPVFSPDGKQFLCRYQEGSNTVWAIFGHEGGLPIKTLPFLPNIENARWMPDGRSIIYIRSDNAASNFWIQPIDGGPAKQITNFTSDVMNGFNISRDGKQIVFERGTAISDVVLITGFKK